MKNINEKLLNSEYVTIDERGWHISKDAPEDLKKEFDEFIKSAEDGAEIEIKGD